MKIVASSIAEGRPSFEVHPVNNGGHVINDRGKTVALVTRHGYVDWLLRSPDEEGECVDHIHKDTHLSYIRGLKFTLYVPYLTDAVGRTGTIITTIDFRVEQGGSRLILIGLGRQPAGCFESRTEAALEVSADGRRYEWKLHTSITSLLDEAHALQGIEYNNLCPARSYRGILHPGEKEFTRTLMEDEEGTVWEFPHQHALHYGRKLRNLKFGQTSWAGYFDSANGCPVITVTQSHLPLHWEICDMYYDLHCSARAPYDFRPRETIAFSYAIGYLFVDEAKAFSQNVRRIEVNDSDRDARERPRFDFGLNHFEQAVRVDTVDEACFFRPAPPSKVWDRETGISGKGSLRLVSQGEAVVWTSEPPFHAVNGTTIRIAGRVRTENVCGRGFFFRLHYYHFVWKTPQGFEPIQVIDSEAISGTSADWLTLTLAPLEVPSGPVEDGMLRLELILQGSGTAWVTDIDIGIVDEPESGMQEESAAIPVAEVALHSI